MTFFRSAILAILVVGFLTTSSQAQSVTTTINGAVNPGDAGSVTIQVTGAPPNTNITIKVTFTNTTSNTPGTTFTQEVQTDANGSIKIVPSTVNVPAGNTGDGVKATGKTTISGTDYSNDATTTYATQTAQPVD